jgi:hypothetical protein
MTDRLHSLTVILETDMRDDDCEPLMDAIRRLRGVLKVEPRGVSDGDFYVALIRAKNEIRDKIFKVLA